MHTVGKRCVFVISALLAGCTVEDEVSRPETDDLVEIPYGPYVCNIAPFVPEGECGVWEAGCFEGDCEDLRNECQYENNGFIDQYPVLIDGSCACYFHCNYR